MDLHGGFVHHLSMWFLQLPGFGTCLCGDFRFRAFLSYLQDSLGISSNLGSQTTTTTMVVTGDVGRFSTIQATKGWLKRKK